MWNFDAFQTAFRIFEDHFGNPEQVMRVLFGTKASDFTEKYGEHIYFIKFTNSYSLKMNQILSKSVSDICFGYFDYFAQSSVV